MMSRVTVVNELSLSAPALVLFCECNVDLSMLIPWSALAGGVILVLGFVASPFLVLVFVVSTLLSSPLVEQASAACWIGDLGVEN